MSEIEKCILSQVNKMVNEAVDRRFSERKIHPCVTIKRESGGWWIVEGVDTGARFLTESRKSALDTVSQWMDNI